MTLRHLKIWIAVYEERNMTAAARRLFMTQPSVSQAIKELESYYEVVLLERLCRKLYVTEAGERAYQYAKYIIKLFNEFENNIKENALRQNFAIGANYTAGVAMIHKYVAKFNQLYPEAEITVNVNKASVLIDKLKTNELDLAIIEEIQNESELVQETICNDHIVVVADPEHNLFSQKTVSARDLADEHLLLREKGAGVRNLFELRMNQLGIPIKPYWESSSTSALINAAQNRLGIAVLPFQLVKAHLESGSLKELKVKNMNLNRKLVIVYHKNKFLTNPMQEFKKICHETL